MKKQLKTLFATLSFSLIFMGCGLNTLQVPKEVKLKTKAKYEFSVLDFDTSKENSKIKLSDYFDIGKMLQEKSSDSFEILKYREADAYQQFLIHMSLPETEFDLSEAFKNMDFADKMTGFDINKTIQIPAIPNAKQTQYIDMDNIRAQLNTIVTCIGTTSDSDLEIGFTSFTTVEYESGYFVVTGTIPDGATVKLFDGSTQISSGTFSSGVAELNIGGKTIKGTGMILKFTDTTGADFSATVKTGSKLKKATGVTVASVPVTVNDITLPASIPDEIEACSVGQGTLTVDIKVPASWSTNIIDDYEIALTGGVTANCTNTSKTADLSGQSLSNTNITAKTNLSLNFSDSTITFGSGNTYKPCVEVTVDIKKFTATVKLDDSYNTAINANQSTDEIKEYVNSIALLPSGFDVTAKNTLPEGNNIGLEISSGFFGMTNVTKTISSGTASTQKLEFRGEEKTVDFSTVSMFDVTGVITLPAYNSSEKTFTVTDVVPGKEYELSLTVTPFIDWASAEVKLPDELATGYSGDMSIGLNKKTLFESFDSENTIAPNLKIKSLPLYLYASVPDTVFTGLKFNGKFDYYYGTKDENTGYITPITTETTLSNKEITFIQLPEFKKNANDEVLKLSKKPEAIEFAPAINNPPDTGSLCIKYNVTPNGGSSTYNITKAQIEELKTQGKASIKIDIVFILSMNFDVTNDIELDLMKIMKKDTGDLFGRSEPTSTGDIDKYIGLAKSSTITLTNITLPFSGDLELLVDMLNDGTGKSRSISDGGSYSVSVNPEKLIKKYPLQPEVKLTVKSGTLTLPRELKASGKLKLGIDAEGEIPIYPFNAQD
ncbi:MAG: hypothetical protein IK024_10455 [Treponema sp.]|nr:hypothetical protein [Treponema sp.]